MYSNPIREIEKKIHFLDKCYYKYYESKKIRYQNECRVFKKNHQIVFEFKIQKFDDSNYAILEAKDTNIHLELNLKEFNQHFHYSLIEDEILSSDRRKIYYYIENKVKKMIQMDFPSKKKMIIILEYGKLEILF